MSPKLCASCNRDVIVVPMVHADGWIAKCSSHSCALGRAAIGATSDDAIWNWNNMMDDLAEKYSSPCIAHHNYVQLLPIDATPDDQYAIRILEAYLDYTCTRMYDNTEGKPNTNPLLDQMNRDQEKRANLLRRAMNILVAINKPINKPSVGCVSGYQPAKSDKPKPKPSGAE